MTRTLKGTEFVTVRCIANDISGAASAAYWLEENGISADHQRRAIIQQAAELGDHLGMKLVPLDSTAAPAADDLRAAAELHASIAECAFDDRPRDRSGHPSHMDWQDGYREGTRAAADAIRDAQGGAPDPAATNAIVNLRHAEAMREEGGE